MWNNPLLTTLSRINRTLSYDITSSNHYIAKFHYLYSSFTSFSVPLCKITLSLQHLVESVERCTHWHTRAFVSAPDQRVAEKSMGEFFEIEMRAEWRHVFCVIEHRAIAGRAKFGRASRPRIKKETKHARVHRRESVFLSACRWLNFNDIPATIVVLMTVYLIARTMVKRHITERFHIDAFLTAASPHNLLH